MNTNMILKGNAIVGQSGGPTAAINATLAGVVRGALENENIGTVYGMKNGIEGLLERRVIDLGRALDTEEKLRMLERTPASALGSCRKKLPNFKSGESADVAVYERIFQIFAEYDIRYFFYIGGNDSMDTVAKVAEFAESYGYDIRIIGVPKTIDNDLLVTDHTPGYGSAAKYVATTMQEIIRDCAVYTTKAVTIVEVMGRDAGWLTAASALPNITGDGPDLIYLPERTFDMNEFLSSVRALLEKKSAVLVCASEGIRFADGEYVGASGQSGAVDVFGHKYLSGTGKVLEMAVKNEIGCKVRSIELSLPQRCASHLSSRTDIEESCGVGAHATVLAKEGKSGVMATILRDDSDCYSVSYGSSDIARIANEVRCVPQNYINEQGNGITDEGIAYIRPLIMGEVSIPYADGMPEQFKF